MWRTFVECGWPAWLIAFGASASVWSAIVAMGLALFRVRRAAIAVAFFALALGALAVFMGPAGMQLGLHKVTRAVATLDRDSMLRAQILAEGRKEATSCVYVGAGFGGPALLLAAVATALAYKRKARATGA